MSTHLKRLDSEIWTVQEVLNVSECEEMIQRGERIGFELATVRTSSGPQLMTSVRNNDRVIFDDAELARKLWDRVREYVPAVLGEARAAGLCVNFRLYRYDPGQRFKRHKDGSVGGPNGERSRLSFLIYLNSGYEGGDTIFVDYTFADGETQTQELRVVPEMGLGLFFVHQRWHEGTALLRGRKYVLRTDVLYSAP